MVQRRSYFRVTVPDPLKVQVLLWHRSGKRQEPGQTQDTAEQMRNGCHGRLVDISAGGAQVVVPQRFGPDPRFRGGDVIPAEAGITAEGENPGSPGQGTESSTAPGTGFKKGQFVGMRFTPLPYETPLMLSAQIRNVLPTADGANAALGLQIVGLEASPEGREVLTRLIGVVERYYQINQSGVKQQNVQPVANAV